MILIVFLLAKLVIAKPIYATYVGLFDENYESFIVNEHIPWHIFNRIYIAFATLDEHGNLTNLNKDADEKIRNITNKYRKVVPDGEIFMSSNYDGDMDQKYINASKYPDKFAQSVISYMRKYQLNGYDMDWESSILFNNYEPLIKLLSSCHKIFDQKYKLTHTIVPQLEPPELLNQVFKLVDQVNIMSYGNQIDTIETYINEYPEAYQLSKMMIGVESERGTDTAKTVQTKIDIILNNTLAGLYLWRIDNDKLKQEYFKVSYLIETYAK
jgi:GH18 family chitinase